MRHSISTSTISLLCLVLVVISRLYTCTHTRTKQRWLAFHALALLNYLFIPKRTLVLLGHCLLPCTVLNSYVYCKCPKHSTTIAYCDVFTINFQTNCSAFDCRFHHIVCLLLLLLLFHPKNSKQSRAEQIKSNSLISKNKLFFSINFPNLI